MTIHRTWHTLININNVKFQLIVLGFVCFLHTILRTSKSIGNNTMKKCYSLLRWPCLLQDVLNRRLLFQNKPAAVAPKETITHHFFVSEIGQKKTVDAATIVAAQKMLKRNWQTFVNGYRFYYFRHLYSAEAHTLSIIMSCPSIWATLSTLLINILLGSFQLFLHDQPLWGWNNPVQRCLPVRGRLHYPRQAWWLHALTDRLLMCNRRRPAAASSRRASFSALASANSFTCILHQAQQHHADASACQ